MHHEYDGLVFLIKLGLGWELQCYEFVFGMDTDNSSF